MHSLFDFALPHQDYSHCDLNSCLGGGSTKGRSGYVPKVCKVMKILISLSFPLSDKIHSQTGVWPLKFLSMGVSGG